MKKKNRLLRIVFIMAFLVSLGLGNELWAATVTFTNGNADGVWTTGTNWSGGAAPTENDDAIIPTGYTVTDAVGITAKSITIDGNSTLTISAAANIALAAPGGITLNGTSTLTISAIVTVTVGDATYRGDIALNDNSSLIFNTAVSTLSLSGTFVKGNDATITRTTVPNLTLTGSTDMTLPSSLASIAAFTVSKTGATVYQSADLTVTGAYTLTNGTYVVGNNDFTISGAANDATLETGTTFNGAASISKNRSFAGDIILKGTATLDLSGLTTNTFTGGANGLAALDFNTAGGSVNLTGSNTTFSSLASSAVGTINANGATLTLNGAAINAYVFTNTTLTTDANTTIDVTGNNSALQVIFPSSVTELYKLTVTRNAVGAIGTNDIKFLANTISFAGDLKVPMGALNLNGKTVVVNGEFSKDVVGNSIVDATGANLTFNGKVDFASTTNLGFVTDNTTSLTFGGTGTIANFPGTGGNTINSLTMNRPGATLTLTAGTGILTFGAGSTFNIIAGTVKSAVANNIVDDATTTTTISADGKLDIDAYSQVFLGTVIGTGTIDASDVDAAITFASDKYGFSTGNLLTSGTATGTMLTFAHPNNGNDYSVTLPASVTALEQLDLVTAGDLGRTIVTLSNDLTIHTAITTAVAR